MHRPLFERAMTVTIVLHEATRHLLEKHLELSDIRSSQILQCTANALVYTTLIQIAAATERNETRLS